MAPAIIAFTRIYGKTEHFRLLRQHVPSFQLNMSQDNRMFRRQLDSVLENDLSRVISFQSAALFVLPVLRLTRQLRYRQLSCSIAIMYGDAWPEYVCMGGTGDRIARSRNGVTIREQALLVKDRPGCLAMVC